MNKKSLLFSFLLVILGGLNLYGADIIGLTIRYDDDLPTIPSGNKGPVRPWYIELDGYELTTSATPCDYTLCLYDEDGEVVYSTFVAEGTTTIVLPSTLSGDYEIRFVDDTYYYYGYIEL